MGAYRPAKTLLDPHSVGVWRHKNKLLNAGNQAEILLQSDSLSTNGKAERFSEFCVMKRKQCGSIRVKAEGLLRHKSDQFHSAVSGSGEKLC